MTSMNTTMDKSNYYSDIVEQSFGDRLKNNPLFVFAFTSFTGIAGYKLWEIKKKRQAGSTERISLQLINTRLVAQGFVIGSLTLLVCYSLGQRVYDNMMGIKRDRPH